MQEIEKQGLKANPIPGAQRTAIGITGNIGVVDGFGQSRGGPVALDIGRLPIADLTACSVPINLIPTVVY